jgi:hypothetical protein
METTGVEFFGENEILPLSASRVTREQIHFCSEAQQDSNGSCRFDLAFGVRVRRSRFTAGMPHTKCDNLLGL